MKGNIKICEREGEGGSAVNLHDNLELRYRPGIVSLSHGHDLHLPLPLLVFVFRLLLLLFVLPLLENIKRISFK